MPSNALKWGKTVTKANGGTTKLVFETVNGLVTFGDRNQLKYVIGSAGTGKQAHHFIPWGKQSENIVQQAAKDPRAFHMNESFNGIPLDIAVHNGSHPLYDARVQARMQELTNTYGANITPAQAYDGLVDIISDIRTAIGNNLTTNINNLIF